MLRKLMESPIGKISAWTLALFTSATLLTAMVIGATREEDMSEDDAEDEQLKEKASIWGVSLTQAREMDMAYRALDQRTDRIFSQSNIFFIPPKEALERFSEELMNDVSQHPPADQEAELIGKLREVLEANIEEKRRSAGAGRKPTLSF